MNLTSNDYNRTNWESDPPIPVVQFEERGVTFNVTCHPVNGNRIFRDAAHLGGPWSRVDSYVANKSVRYTFRKRLSAALNELNRLIEVNNRVAIDRFVDR